MFDSNSLELACKTSNSWVNGIRKGIIEYVTPNKVLKDAEKLYKYLPNKYEPLLMVVGRVVRPFLPEAKVECAKYLGDGYELKKARTVTKEYACLLVDIVLQADDIALGKSKELGHGSGMWLIKRLRTDDEQVSALKTPLEKAHWCGCHILGSSTYGKFTEDNHEPGRLWSLGTTEVIYLPEVVESLGYPKPDTSDEAFADYEFGKGLKEGKLSKSQWKISLEMSWDAYGSKFPQALKELATGDSYFIEYMYDSRGRIYARSDLGNFTGDKYLRGAIAFGKGETVNKGGLIKLK